MKVEGINPHSAIARQSADLSEPEQETQETQETGEVTQPQQADPEPVEQEQDDGEGTGVLRLLQEGHFKGVSDVRLRINFSDELAAIQAAKTQTVADEKRPEVASAVRAVVDSFTAENELSEEQAAAIEELKLQFEQAAAEPAEDPVAAMTSAFQAFVEALQNLFEQVVEAQEPQPQVEELIGEASGEQIGAENTEQPEATPEPEAEPAGETSGEETGAVTAEEPEPIPLPEEEGPDWQGFIENLQDAFSQAMQELQTNLSAAAVLPLLSEPSGNGVAYEKFLTIYNQMLGVSGASEEATDTLA